jgi:hypothetical protein
MQRFYKIFCLKVNYKYIIRLLNLFTNYIVRYMFRPSLAIIRCYNIVLWRLLCLLFSSSEAPSHSFFVVPLCVFRPPHDVKVCAGFR